MNDPLQLPGFELIEKIGQGGMAVVWKARQISLDRVVAIKLLSPQAACRPGDQERLLAEAHAAAHLKHPGIVQVYDAGITDGMSYFVMEYVAGYSVGQWLRRKQVLPPIDAVTVIECVAQALHYAWKTAGIIHCDIKPDNVMVDLDGTIKVADLGLARTIGSVNKGDSGKIEVMGTPGYISPEQSGGRFDLDARADIYSLGATLYHLVTGKRLFERHGDTEAMDLQVTGHEVDPLLLRHELPIGVCWLIEKMLVKNRDHRYPDWEAVIADIERVKNGLLPAKPYPPAGASTITRSENRKRTTREWEQNRTLERRRRVWGRRVPMAAVILGFGLLTLYLWLDARRQSRRQRLDPVTVVATNGTVTVVQLPGEPPGESDAAKGLYEFVMRWIADNPDQYDEAIRRLTRVVDGTRGTRYSMMAEDAIDQVREKRDAAIETVFRELHGQMENLAQTHRYQDAAAMADAYDGPWQQALRPRLQRQADEYRQQANDHEAARQRLASEADQRFSVVISELTDTLLNRSMTEAMAQIEPLASEPVLAVRQNDVRALADLIRNALQLDREVLQSFAAQAHTEITINLVQGPRTLYVRGARDGRLRMEQRLEGGARVEFEFGIQDLSSQEYLGRLADPERQEVALVSGLHAFRTQAYETAATYFAKTMPLIGAPLREQAVSAHRAQREERAQTDFNQMLQQLTVEERPPAFAAIAHTLRTADLSKAPPTLRPWIEQFRENHQGTDFLQQAGGILTALTDALEQAAARVDEPEPLAASATPIDERDLEAVTEMLRNRNPGLEQHAIRVLRDPENRVYGLEIRSPALRDIGPLAPLRGLRSLDCRGGEIRDLSVLASLNDLIEVHIEGCAARDFQPLARLPLRKLGLPRSTFSDTGILRNMPLQELDISHTPVRDVAGLRGIALRALNLENTRVFTLHGLAGMPLERLNLAGTQVKDISILRGMPLQELNLARTGAFDFSIIRSMKLRSLDVAETQFRDIALLEGMPLQSLDLSGTRITDVNGLRDLPLRQLALRNTAVRDLAPLRGAIIQNLYLDQCRNVRSLEFAGGMPLRELSISGTGIDALADLRSRDLHTLFMENTAISDISPLRGLPMRTLHLRGSPIRDYGPLATLPVQDLTIDIRNDASRQILSRIRTLRRVNGGTWPPPPAPRR